MALESRLDGTRAITWAIHLRLMHLQDQPEVFTYGHSPDLGDSSKVAEVLRLIAEALEDGRVDVQWSPE